jgi:tetratricopeptide (TPR) repeat protein
MGKHACARLIQSSLLLFLSLLGATAAAASASTDLASAQALFEAGRFPEAQQLLGRMDAADPANADVHYYLGRIALELGDPDTAVHEMERAVALAPGNARDHSGLGMAYGKAAEKDGMVIGFALARRCVAQFERAVELDPGDIDARILLFKYYSRAPGIVGGGAKKAAEQAAAIGRLDRQRGLLAFAGLDIAKGKFDAALAELDEVLKAEPTDYEALYLVGRVAAASGHHLDRGLACLRLCLTLPVSPGAPSHAAAQWCLGNLLDEMGAPGLARSAYRTALQLDPHFSPFAEFLKDSR